MHIIDAHTHLDRVGVGDDLRCVVQRAHAANVVGWVVAGAAPKDWECVRQTAAQTHGIAVLGIHPWWVPHNEEDLADTIARLKNLHTPHGLGEMGLDRVRATEPSLWHMQNEALKAQLALAIARDLPIVLHCVRAWPALRKVLEGVGLPAAGGMIHGWSGPAAHAEEAVAMGLHLSFGPSLARSRKASESLQQVPLNRLLVETDCPDRPIAGASRGEPAHLPHVVSWIAQRLDRSPAVIAHHTYENSRRLFRYDPPVR